MNVMKRAWVIAKEGVKKFGGNVKEYFAMSLKMAWEELKAMSNNVVELVGSEKQIKWAKDIIAKAKVAIDQTKELLEKDSKEAFESGECSNFDEDDYKEDLEAIALIDKKFNEVFQNTSAKFYIELFGYSKEQQIIKDLAGHIESDNEVDGYVLDQYRNAARVLFN